MIAQINQVLATYWRRAISKPFAFVAVIIPVIGVVLAVIALLTGEAKGLSFEKDQTASTLIWIGMLGFYCPILIAIHFKQQVIQIHQRRIASAVMAHVIVVVGLLALCCVVLPTALMAIGVWSWGALGLTVALSAVTILVFALQGWFALLAFPLAFVGMAAALSPVQKWLQELCLGRHEAFGLLLLAAGIGGIVATLVRLLQMTEESTGYWNIYDFDLSDLNAFYKATYGSRSFPQGQPSTDDAHARGWLWKTLGVIWKMLAWTLTSPEPEVQMWPQWARGSWWERTKLWGVVLTGSTRWPFDIFFIGLFSAEFVWWPEPASRSTFMMSDAMFMMAYPAFCVMGSLWQHKTLAIESLRPAGRSQFLIEMGLLYACRVVAAWVVLNISWCVPAYAFVSDAPHWGYQVVNLLVLSAALQVVLFGLTFWLMHFVGAFVTWTALFALSMTAIFVPMCIPCDWRNASLDALLWVSPAIVATGALITWDAHRRWMRTELG